MSPFNPNGRRVEGIDYYQCDYAYAGAFVVAGDGNGGALYRVNVKAKVCASGAQTIDRILLRRHMTLHKYAHVDYTHM